MSGDWTAEIVGRMHTARITRRQLAAKCGYSAAYLSTVLNGKKGVEKTRITIFEALAALEAQKSSSDVSDSAGVSANAN